MIKELNDIRDSRRGYLGETAGIDNDELPKVIQVSDLIKIARSVLDEELIDNRSKKEWKEYRTRINDTYWNLQTIAGSYPEPTWRAIIEAALNGLLKNVRHQQPNGNWRIYEYEIDVSPDKRGVERFVMAVRWVDAENKMDLEYRDGVPAVSVQVNAPSLPDEVINALSNKDTNDGELKELLKNLIVVMGSNADTTSNEAETAAPVE